MRQALRELGALIAFIGSVLKSSVRPDSIHGSRRSLVLAQMLDVYQRSLVTVLFAGFFVGAILALQFTAMLSVYEARSLTGGLTASACIREVGPLIISFLLAGKVGAYTAAELGTMRITDQIDAIECLGTDPLEYLVVPRFIAIVSASVLLLVVGLMVALLGSMLVASLAAGVNPLQFISGIPRFAGFEVFAAGMLKSFTYGIIVAGVSCHQGYTARGGALGVGRAVTWAAIYTNLYIVLANFVLGQALDAIASLRGGV